MTQKSAEQEPNDWFVFQRAFPGREINTAAQLLAHRQALQKRARAKASGAALAPWLPAGPDNIGGRITDLAVHPDQPEIIYAGAASGGVLKSSDFGATWQMVFDDQPSLSIGALAVAPSNPSVIYAGTGEANVGGGSSTFGGIGMAKSSDGGQTWQWTGLASSRYIGRIVIDPRDENRVFVAAAGNLFSRNPERGVYRSRDGGASWERVLFVSDSTAAIDLAINPQNPEIIFAATWERLRALHFRRMGGVTSGIYRSQNGGTTWTRLGGGLPAPPATSGRIGIAIAASRPETIYAVYADDVGFFRGIYKSTNNGESWQRADQTNLPNFYSNYGWWFGKIVVDPTNADHVFALGIPLFRSTDGGRQWQTTATRNHVDHHALYIDPKSPRLLIDGNDGGVYVTDPGAGFIWKKSNNLPITQFYSITIDPTNPNLIYAGLQRGNWYKSQDTGESFAIAMNGIDSGERKNWTTPVVMDPSNPQVLYYGAQRVYKTRNAAATWNPISPDLTNGSGGGNLTFGTITTIAVASSDTAVLYAGTDDGNVWGTLDGGKNWRKLSAALPLRWITRVAADPHNPLVAYVTLSGFRTDEPLAHVFCTADGGLTWQAISADLPEAPVNEIIIDPRDSHTLFIGTDYGVYFSTNTGASWQPLGAAMPLVAVTDMDLHDGTRTLVAATYGRSAFRFDLNNLTAVANPRQVLPTQMELAQNYPNPFSSAAKSRLSGNPATTIRFQLSAFAEVKLQVYRVLGKLVRELVNASMPAGTHEIVWDARDENGQLVASGSYIYRLQANGQTLAKMMRFVK
ncbi:MAG: FlgD immunoglobulin-like domain containing protein [bacterium]